MPKSNKVGKRLHKNVRGIALIYGILFIILTLAFGALVVDIGIQRNFRFALKTATDSAALAAVGILVVNPNDGPTQAAAINAAITYAGKYVIYGKPVTITASQVKLGTWNSTTHVFTATNTNPNAVQVFASLPTTIFFAQAFGGPQTMLNISSIAGSAPPTPMDIVFILDIGNTMSSWSWLTNRNLWSAGSGPPAFPASSTAVPANLNAIWQALGSPKIGTYFKDGTTVYTATPPASCGAIHTVVGTKVCCDPAVTGTYASCIQTAFGLTAANYPYPAATPNGGNWNGYVTYVKGLNSSTTFQNKFGYPTLIDYWLETNQLNTQVPDFWKTTGTPPTAVGTQPLTAAKNAIMNFVLNYFRPSLENISIVDFDNPDVNSATVLLQWTLNNSALNLGAVQPALFAPGVQAGGYTNANKLFYPGFLTGAFQFGQPGVRNTLFINHQMVVFTDGQNGGNFADDLAITIIGVFDIFFNVVPINVVQIGSQEDFLADFGLTTAASVSKGTYCKVPTGQTNFSACVQTLWNAMIKPGLPELVK